MIPTWRVGNKVPINVYDGDRPVCQCQTEADAKLIVRAVNDLLERMPVMDLCDIPEAKPEVSAALPPEPDAQLNAAAPELYAALAAIVKGEPGPVLTGEKELYARMDRGKARMAAARAALAKARGETDAE